MGTLQPPVSRSRRPPRPARGRMIRVRVSDEEYAALAEKGAAVGGMSTLLRDHLGTIWSGTGKTSGGGWRCSTALMPT